MSAGTEQANEATAAASAFRADELVPARNAAIVVAAYDALGEDADGALGSFGWSRERVAAPDALVPAALTFQLLALASARDPTFPVRAGARLPWGHAGLIDYVNGSRATLGAVKECLGDRVPGAVAWNLYDIDAKFADVETVDTCVNYLNNVAGWNNNDRG